MADRIQGNGDAAFWLVMEAADKQLSEAARDARKTTLALGEAQGAATLQRSHLVYESHIKQHHANFTDARMQMAGAVLGAMGEGQNGNGGESGDAGGAGGQEQTSGGSQQLIAFLQNNLGFVGEIWKMASGDFKPDKSVKGLITTMSQSALQRLSEVQGKMAEENREEAQQLERAEKAAAEVAAEARRFAERARQEREEIREMILRAREDYA